MRKFKITELFKIIISYYKDFPKNERKSLFKMIKLYFQKKIKIYVLNDFFGYVIIHENRDIVLIDYFVIFKIHRNKNYGSEFLKIIQDHFQKTIVLEVELPESLIQEKRILFYEKNGFHKTSIYSYLYGIPLLIMVNNDVDNYFIINNLESIYNKCRVLKEKNC